MKNIVSTDESVKSQITDSISEHFTTSDLESKFTNFTERRFNLRKNTFVILINFFH